MPNIAVAFREEITRLARREIRRQTAAMRKGSAQFRRDIAALKRHAAELKSKLVRLERRGDGNGGLQSNESMPGRIRFSARSVVAQRKRLEVSAADYGKLIGVTGHTIYKWEHGTSRPRRAQLTALASVRGLGKREAVARLQQMREQAAKRRTRRQ